MMMFLGLILQLLSKKISIAIPTAPATQIVTVAAIPIVPTLTQVLFFCSLLVIFLYSFSFDNNSSNSFFSLHHLTDSDSSDSSDTESESEKKSKHKVTGLTDSKNGK